MTFKKGESGNAAGRPKGIPNKRTQLAKLLEPHAEKLIAKAVELALDGDVQALKLCLDKILPKAAHAQIDIEIPDEINATNADEVKAMILRAALEGKVSVADAEKLAALIADQARTNPLSAGVPVIPTDPVEAAKVYARFMRES